MQLRCQEVRSGQPPFREPVTPRVIRWGDGATPKEVARNAQTANASHFFACVFRETKTRRECVYPRRPALRGFALNRGGEPHRRGPIPVRVGWSTASALAPRTGRSTAAPRRTRSRCGRTVRRRCGRGTGGGTGG